MKYKIHCPFLKNNELTELTETIRCLTGAEYNDIYVSEVNNGCVKVCFMVRNHLIPKLRKCYMPENINNTHQSLSKDLRNKIIKMVIQDEVVDLTDIHRFGNVLKPKVKAALFMYLLFLCPQYRGHIVLVLSVILSFSNSVFLSFCPPL